MVVRKTGGKVRICGDFKITINPVLKTDINALPLPEELFQSLNGGCKFSKINLADAYLQIELDEESSSSQHSQGFVSLPMSSFWFKLCSSVVSKIIDQTIADIPGVMCYIDDIIITGKMDQEHTANIRKAVEKLKAAGFHIKREKCKSFQSQVQYSHY